MSDEIETPRTNAAEWSWGQVADNGCPNETTWVPASFSRQLECELYLANKRIQELEAQHSEPTKKLKLDAQIKALPIPVSLSNYSGFLNSWERWVAHRRKLRKVRDFVELFRKQLEELDSWGNPALAVEALNTAYDKQWQSFHKPIYGRPANKSSSFIAKHDAASLSAADQAILDEARGSGRA